MAHTTIDARDGRSVDLEYQTFGARADPAVLLVMGTGMSMIGWDEVLCRDLASEGFFVVRYDHRDIGRSSKITPTVDPIAALLSAFDGTDVAPPYTVADMAGDALGLLDRLDIERAHVIGASLGGMIAQWLAIDHPERVLTLTAVCTTTGEPHVGQPDPAVLPLVLKVVGEGRADFVAHQVRLRQAVGGPLVDPAQVRRSAGAMWDHAEGPQNRLHHLAAAVHAPSTAGRLAQLSVPTLVIHGDADPLIDISGGRRIAGLVPGARLVVVEGMGHDLPPVVHPAVMAAVTHHLGVHPQGSSAGGSSSAGAQGDRRVPSAVA